MRPILRLRRALAMRLTMGVALGLAAVTLGIGVYAMVTEERDLQRAVTAETLLLTRSVQIAFENAIRDRQIDDIEQTLAELELIEPRMGIFVVGPERTVVTRSPGANHLPTVPRDGHVHFIETEDGPVAAMHVALVVPVSGYTGLIVTRPLESMVEDLAHTRLQVLATVLASIAASSVLLLVIFRRSVERPLARMTHAMRRFREAGQQELQEPFADDEMGEALREFAVLARELHDARQNLEREQEERAVLDTHLERLDKLATVGQLSARVAHEIGSPLQVLEGRLSSLRRELGGQLPAARLVDIALEQTQRITRVVSQLLAVARPAAAIGFECDPARAAVTIAEFLEIEAKRHGIKLSVDVSRAPLRVPVAQDHVSQVVLNLLRNALEATPRGGEVQLCLSAEPNGSGEQLRIAVVDNGRGMSAEERERAFEPFFTTRAESGGTGLGLPIVRSFARRYGGSVSVSSEPGQGARFDVVIPFERVANEEVEQHGGASENAADRG
ncbi:MAG TPA: HAMP domain-containing sensor histidine kinase [Polyangiales bacterium]|nr:HAMP domain-containing sensor histidine kinase [Polyangiales bacterium]